MLILTAINVTPDAFGPDGTAYYEVEVKINRHVIWRGAISGHKRANGAENLLRLIADRIEAQGGEPFHG